jgi:UDP-N-acetylglucosamine 2-epimerase (non-hydrolysing)
MGDTMTGADRVSRRSDTVSLRSRVKAMVVFGTRPEAIKLAPVVLALEAHDAFNVVAVSSGQHRDMIAPICRLFDITPDHDLAVMKPGQSLDHVTAAVIERLGECLRLEQPDVVIVQGDTTTAFASALAAFYHKVPVAHVEAGLRTGDMTSPWPEEANRVLIGRLAAWHYPPTAGAAANLIAEGAATGNVLTTGNTVIDAARFVASRQTPAYCDAAGGRLGLGGRPFLLFTMHRRESFGADIDRVFRALDRFARLHAIDVLFPVHPNPNVFGPAHALLASNPHIHLVAPLDYDEMVFALGHCRFVITDSGGLVEEAPTFGKPVLVLRETTERRESVDAGGAFMVGTDTRLLIDLAGELLADGPRFAAMSRAPNPFGDGHAATRIADHLAAALGAITQAERRAA